jgi:hypothetical protein
MFWKERQEEETVDLESYEMCIRSSMHSIGSVMLEMIINADVADYGSKSISCDHGHEYAFKEFRSKKLLTVLGPIKVNRAYYYDRDCKSGYCPTDRSLHIEGTSYSPGVRRMMGRLGTLRTFGLSQKDLEEIAGVCVTSKGVERVCHDLGQLEEKYYWQEANLVLSGKVTPLTSAPMMYILMDGTGVPVVPLETVDRKGKNSDHAKTREAKLGCIFTQTAFDEKGRPVRDNDSTTYVGAIENAEQFGNRIYSEAIRRGLQKAKKTCVIGDGAPWIWNLADEHFYGATQIIDLYHAREHFWNVAKIAFADDRDKMRKWAQKRRRELDGGKVENVIEAIKKLSVSTEKYKEVFEKESGYFTKNIERMRYARFRKQGLFVGSGVVEAGCKTVIAQRFKQSGMRWTVKGANSIIALRCCFMSNQWEDFWEFCANI